MIHLTKLHKVYYSVHVEHELQNYLETEEALA